MSDVGGEVRDRWSKWRQKNRRGVFELMLHKHDIFFSHSVDAYICYSEKTIREKRKC